MIKNNILKLRIKAHIICALILSTLFTNAQNLVFNPSFELHTIACHNMKPGGQGATGWYNPDVNQLGSYSYCNSCSDSICCSVPFNFYGYGFQYANTGNAFIEEFFMSNMKDHRNYIQTKLLKPLTQGKCYYVEFYVNNENFYLIATNNIGLLIGDTGILSYGSKYTAANPQIQQFGNPVIKDTLNWVKVAGVYIAHGGEQYITIGNFKDDAHTDTLMYTIPGEDDASYNIDDVSVIPLDSMQVKADAGRDTTIVKGDSVWIGSRLCGLQNVVWYDARGNVIDTGVPGLWVKPTINNYYVIEQNVCGQYSRDTVNITVQALPVTIMNYELGIKNGIQGRAVENVWVTSTEINTAYFNVQRSTDGINFWTIGKVIAKGASIYRYIDNTNLTGVIYYRLEIVDKNGSVTYSEVKELTIENGQLTISPNPSKDYITVIGNNIKQVIICDISGRLLLKSIERKVDISGLVSGTYMVQVETLNGNHVTQKFIRLY